MMRSWYDDKRRVYIGMRVPRLFDGIENRNALDILAAFAGSDSGENRRSVCTAL
jgi:hypothetical protein